MILFLLSYMEEKKIKSMKCLVFTEVHSRALRLAEEYTFKTGKKCDYKKYVNLAIYIERNTNDILTKEFIFENGRFLNLNMKKYYATNLLVQLDSVTLQKISHNYKNMIDDMVEHDFISKSDSFCHASGLKSFCKSYTINTKLLFNSISKNIIPTTIVDIPKAECEKLIELANKAKEIKCVKFYGNELYFDIDSALDNVIDDISRKTANTELLTFYKMKSALIAWIDSSRNHKDTIVDFRNFHFLTSMSKAALKYIKNKDGKAFHEIIDIPSSNILTTAISFHNSKKIPDSEYYFIKQCSLSHNTSIYDLYIYETGCPYSRNFIKKCFQMVINCSDSQIKYHNSICSDTVFEFDKDVIISSCISSIIKWMSSKLPCFENSLRNFIQVKSSNKNTETPVKGIYYAFTYVEKFMIEYIQSVLSKDGIKNTIRIHDAIWGFDYVDDYYIKDLILETINVMEDSGISISESFLKNLIQNKLLI